MKNRRFLFLILFFGCALNAVAQNTNRVPFTIAPTDRHIVLPVYLNDSTMANMMFDTGGSLILDSFFCASHHLTFNSIPDSVPTGSAWSSIKIPGLFYKTSQTIKIGDVHLAYNNVNIYNYKRDAMTNSDGVFNIPEEDTTHVWELNFEHNYLEIHSAEGFQMPKNCFLFPMVKYWVKVIMSKPVVLKYDTLITNGDTTITTTTTATGTTITTFTAPTDSDNTYLKKTPGRDIYIKLPMQIKSADGDTLTMNDMYSVDTGMPWDIAVLRPTESESDFFNRRKDVVWLAAGHGMVDYIKRYSVNATLFNDNFQADSLRFYVFDDPKDIGADYLIGQNFLKRFNVFFDMQNRQVGLQPINNFQRTVNPNSRRFYYSSHRTSDGHSYIVDMIADYKDNPYKKAGLREGDEVIAVNGIPVKDITYQNHNNIWDAEKQQLNVLRNGQYIKIVIHIDKKFDRVD